MVSGILSTAGKYGEYGAHFLFGTGAMTTGERMGKAIKCRKRLNMNLSSAAGYGLKNGVQKSYAEMKAAGGFFKSLGKTFSELPGNMAAGWKGARGISKVWHAIKPLGKVMPFIGNALWFATSIPDIVDRAKTEGIWGGIKETGKTLINMGVFSLAAAVGGACFGLGGTLILPIVAGMLTTAIIGKSWGEKKAEKEAEQMAQNQNNPFAQQPQVGQKLDIVSR